MTARPREIPDGVILALVGVAQFMVILDVSIVNVALPSIRNDLHMSTVNLQWVVNAYAIAYGGLLLLGGRAADLYGRRRVFLAGLGLFTAASLAGGAAQDGSTLIAARIAQGVGAAILSPATLTILTTTFPEGPRRARALGVWSALAGAGGAAGALLGGVLTDYASWRWILFVNVPVGIAAIIAARALLNESRLETERRDIDVLGAVLVTAGLMVFVYGVVGTDTHAWSSLQTVVALAIAVVLLGWFFLHETRVARTPLVPLSIFRNRSVAAANGVMFCAGAAIFPSWFFLTLYMQTVLGYSPLKTGLAFIPQTLAIIVGAQVASRLLNNVGPRVLLTIAPAISAAGLLWLSRIDAHGTYLATLLGPMVLITLGMGLAFTPLAWAATSGVPREQAGLASGLLNTNRQVGGGLGLAVLATVAVDRTRALHESHGAALAAGYGRALLIAAFVSAAAWGIAFSVPKLRREPPTESPPAGALAAPAVALPEAD